MNGVRKGLDTSKFAEMLFKLVLGCLHWLSVCSKGFLIASVMYELEEKIIDFMIDFIIDWLCVVLCLLPGCIILWKFYIF